MRFSSLFCLPQQPLASSPSRPGWNAQLQRPSDQKEESVCRDWVNALQNCLHLRLRFVPKAQSRAGSVAFCWNLVTPHHFNPLQMKTCWWATLLKVNMPRQFPFLQGSRECLGTHVRLLWSLCLLFATNIIPEPDKKNTKWMNVWNLYKTRNHKEDKEVKRKEIKPLHFTEIMKLPRIPPAASHDRKYNFPAKER